MSGQSLETGPENYREKVVAFVRTLSIETIDKAIEEDELSIGGLPTASEGDNILTNQELMDIVTAEKAARQERG